MGKGTWEWCDKGGHEWGRGGGGGGGGGWCAYCFFPSDSLTVFYQIEVNIIQEHRLS